MKKLSVLLLILVFISIPVLVFAEQDFNIINNEFSNNISVEYVKGSYIPDDIVFDRFDTSLLDLGTNRHMPIETYIYLLLPLILILILIAFLVKHFF